MPPQTPAWPPPPHVCGATQVPHCKSPPQPSPAGPQLNPSAAHVVGVQLGAPHTPDVPPPPQVCGAVQLPQLKSPPQPSPAGPQLKPS